jgi:hypothetical protein
MSLPKTILPKVCWIVAILLTAVAVLLHFFSFTVVGGLWRDEIAIVNIATTPSWAETFRALPYDHCPIVFPAIVRTWTALGLAPTDTGLRVLGLCIGFFLLASFWAASRMMGKSLPLVSLSLVALNPLVIRYGDSIRGYALGMAFILLTMGLIWRFIEQPDVRHGLLAGMGAVVSVQTLYQNAFFLLAICVAGMVVCLRQRQLSKAAGVLGVGFVAALSLLPYVNPIRTAQNWWVVSQSGTSLTHDLDLLSELTGPFLYVWLVVAVLAVALSINRVAISVLGGDKSRDQEDLLLFGGITLVLGAISFWVFIKLSGLPTQVWYYIPVLCFTVLCCDVILSRASPPTTIGVLLVAVYVLMVFPSAYSALRWRQTNGDLVAAQVSKAAGPDDLIIVHPWHNGLTFAYYYRGAAPWTTLPPIGDYRFHRYDLIKVKLQMTNAITPVLERVETTLRSGNRVWIVGQIHAPPPDGKAPDSLPPAPNKLYGWSDAPYFDAWGVQLSYLLEQHSTNVVPLVNPRTNSPPINTLEPMMLIVTRGWKDSNQPVSIPNSETNKP